MKSLVILFFLIFGSASCDVRHYENIVSDMSPNSNRDISFFDMSSNNILLFNYLSLSQSNGCLNSLIEDSVIINPFISRTTPYSKCEADYIVHLNSSNLRWILWERPAYIKIKFSYKAKFYLAYDINTSAFYLDTFEWGIMNSHGTRIGLGTISGYDIQKDQGPDRGMSVVYKIPRMLPGDDILGIYIHVISQNKNISNIVIPDAYYTEKTKMTINSIELVERF
jgi:hypothetical protein